MFYVGQKVVRIGVRRRGNACLRGATYSKPEVGEVCTIKTINVWPEPRGTLLTLLTLVEHDNSHLTVNGWEPGFAACCFRPVVERKTDIGALTALLNPSNHKHLEGV